MQFCTAALCHHYLPALDPGWTAMKGVWGWHRYAWPGPSILLTHNCIAPALSTCATSAPGMPASPHSWVAEALRGGGTYGRDVWEQSVVPQKRSRTTVWCSALLLRCRAMRCWCGMSKASAMAAKPLCSDTCRRPQLKCNGACHLSNTRYGCLPSRHYCSAWVMLTYSQPRVG